MAKYKSKTDNNIGSSGLKKMRSITKEVRRTKMKINRWKRYKKENRGGDQSRWDISGLEGHVKLLESLV